MRLQLTVRHGHVNDGVRSYVETKFAKLGKRLHATTLVEVVLDRERNPRIVDDHVVEVELHVKGPNLHGREAATTLRGRYGPARRQARAPDRAPAGQEGAGAAPASECGAARAGPGRGDRAGAQRLGRRVTVAAAARSRAALGGGRDPRPPPRSRLGRRDDRRGARGRRARGVVRRPRRRPDRSSRTARPTPRRSQPRSRSRPRTARALCGGRAGSGSSRRARSRRSRLEQDPGGTRLEVTWDGSERTVRIDGEPTLAGIPELERIGAARYASYVVTASRPRGRRLGDPRRSAVALEPLGQRPGAPADDAVACPAGAPAVRREQHRLPRLQRDHLEERVRAARNVSCTHLTALPVDDPALAVVEHARAGRQRDARGADRDLRGRPGRRVPGARGRLRSPRRARARRCGSPAPSARGRRPARRQASPARGPARGPIPAVSSRTGLPSAVRKSRAPVSAT